VARNVLIKRVLPHVSEDPGHLALFHQEAKISAHLRHPNIAGFYESGEVQGAHYIAREFVHGQPLDTVLRQAQRTPSVLSHALALRIGASVCEGLHYAHTRVDHLDRPLGLVHRELAARHILLGFDGGVKLIGFGGRMIADYQNERRGGLVMLSFDSMAPEQVAGKELDPRTDIFAAALVLYELLTGVHPLRRDSNLETVEAVRECRIPPPSQVAHIPAVLDSVVMQALAREKEDRYPDAREFQLALEGCLLACRWEVGTAGLSAMMQALFPTGAGAAY
jgi:serine/threonine protein kinase